MLMISLNSCATTDQLSQLEKRQDALVAKVSGFEKKYKEVLEENDLLKGKLQDLIPLAKVEEAGIVYEVMKATRLGKSVTLELVITNKTDEKIDLTIAVNKIIIADEYGNRCEGIRVDKKSNYSRPELYPSSPFKIIISADKFKKESNYIGVLGFGEVWPKNDVRAKFSIYLKNIKL